MLEKVLKCSLIFALTSLWLLPGAEAQGDGSAAAAPSATEAQQRSAGGSSLSEREIAARIQAVQQQAMQHPELAAGNREIAALIAATLPRVDSEYPTYVARAATLRAEVSAAQAAGDNGKLRELAEETQDLQRRISEAQEKAREHSAVKEKLNEFKVKLFTRMVEIDPEVQELVNQLATLRADGAAGDS
ncbi:MAG: hypothetical protein KY464_03015 [Gemmatimonadetes bacterium]|nr:hypothetical protein [Gemmatimonadota bacterium]